MTRTANLPNPLRSPRLLLAPVLAVVALTAVGCTRSTSGVLDLPADEALATAVDRSSSHDTVRMRIRTVNSFPELGELTAIHEGVSGGGRGQFTMTLERTGGAPIEADLRFVDGIAYQRAEVYQAAYGTDAEWISTDLDTDVQGAEALRHQVRLYDLTQALSQLYDSPQVSEVGSETVNGFSTKRYTASTTMRAALGATGLAEATVQQLAGDTGVDLDATVPIAVWIDDRGLVRRMHVKVIAGTSTTDTTTDILEYGVAVDVTPPPADETVSMEDLQG